MAAETGTKNIASRAGADVGRLAQRTVDLAKPASDRYELRDPGLPGFMVRISPGGQKTFYVSTRVGRGRDGRRVRVQIGDASVLTLPEARQRARRVIADAKDGIDPTGVSGAEQISLHLHRYAEELDRRGVVRLRT